MKRHSLDYHSLEESYYPLVLANRMEVKEAANVKVWSIVLRRKTVSSSQDDIKPRDQLVVGGLGESVCLKERNEIVRTTIVCPFTWPCLTYLKATRSVFEFSICIFMIYKYSRHSIFKRIG